MAFALLGHHLLGDGISFVIAMRDLLTALDGRLDGARLMPPVMQDASSLPAQGRLGWPAKLLANKMNRDYAKSGRRFTYSDYRSMYETYNRGKRPAMRTFSFRPGETRRLIDLCHLHRATVNDAITTAFVAARDRAGIQSVYVGVSCSIRQEMATNPNGGMANYVSGVAISATYDDSLDFWTNAKNVGDLLHAKLSKPRQRMAAVCLLDALTIPWWTP